MNVYAQGDLIIVKLPSNLAIKLDKSVPLKKLSTNKGMRLLEGEVTGHHHTIETYSEADAAKLVTDKLDGILRNVETKAVLYQDNQLIDDLVAVGIADPDNPDRLRRLAIGFLEIVVPVAPLTHPEHDTIALMAGVYYVGRQVESAGADERIVAD